jgi:hypothetical protein
VALLSFLFSLILLLELRCREFGEPIVDLYDYNGKYHKEVVCVCCLVREAYSQFKDLQTTLSLAPIEAFPNGDASKKGRRWRVIAMGSRGF